MYLVPFIKKHYIRIQWHRQGSHNSWGRARNIDPDSHCASLPGERARERNQLISDFGPSLPQHSACVKASIIPHSHLPTCLILHRPRHRLVILSFVLVGTWIAASQEWSSLFSFPQYLRNYFSWWWYLLCLTRISKVAFKEMGCHK